MSDFDDHIREAVKEGYMSDQSIEVRMAVVEYEAGERKRLMEEIRKQSENQSSVLHNVDKKLEAISMLLSAMQDLPARVKALEDLRTETKGGWKLIVMAGTVGAGIVKLLDWLRTAGKP